MQPQSEAEWEEAVTFAARRAALAWMQFVACQIAACREADDAEAAGVVGAARLLPASLVAIDHQSAAFYRTLTEPVERGLVTVDEARAVLNGESQLNHTSED